MSSIGARYFQADEDDDLLMEENDDSPTPLSWRGDPERTHSDWTVIVTSDTDNEASSSQTYHVHKAVLAAGAHPCLYFSTLFSTQAATAEQEQNTSHITLGKEEAKAFPIMLDFVYSVNDTLEHVSAESAVPLRSLARYFRCKALMKHVNEFIQQDLGPETALTYLCIALDCNDEKLEQSARNLIVENYDDIDDEAMQTLPFQVFRSIVCSPQLDASDHHIAGADVVRYFENNPTLLNVQNLFELTDHLTDYTITTARCLTNMLGKLDLNENDESWPAFNKLSKLCADSLASCWNSLDTEQSMTDFKNPAVSGNYRISGQLVISRLVSALERAKVDSTEMSREINEKNQEIERLRTQLEAHSLADPHVEELDEFFPRRRRARR